MLSKVSPEKASVNNSDTIFEILDTMNMSCGPNSVVKDHAEALGNARSSKG